MLKMPVTIMLWLVYKLASKTLELNDFSSKYRFSVVQEICLCHLVCSTLKRWILSVSFIVASNCVLFGSGLNPLLKSKCYNITLKKYSMKQINFGTFLYTWTSVSDLNCWQYNCEPCKELLEFWLYFAG